MCYDLAISQSVLLFNLLLMQLYMVYRTVLHQLSLFPFPWRDCLLLLVSRCLLIKHTLPLMSLISSHLLQSRQSPVCFMLLVVFFFSFICLFLFHCSQVTPSATSQYCVRWIKIDQNNLMVRWPASWSLVFIQFNSVRTLPSCERYRFVAPYLWQCSTLLAYFHWQSVRPV